MIRHVLTITLSLWCLLIQADLVPTPTRTHDSPVLSARQASPAPTACSRCLLEAFAPATLSYPTPVVGNFTSVTALVYAYPIVDPQGHTISISYTTVSSTKIEIKQNETAIFNATWTTLGTTLTWPTTYIAFKTFGLAPDCTGATASLPLPRNTDPARLIFPLVGDMSNVRNDVVSYLNGLHEQSNVTDLAQCSWAINDKSLQARQGRLPVPVGPRLIPLEGDAYRESLELMAHQLNVRQGNITVQPSQKVSVGVLTQITETKPARTQPAQQQPIQQTPQQPPQQQPPEQQPPQQQPPQQQPPQQQPPQQQPPQQQPPQPQPPQQGAKGQGPQQQQNAQNNQGQDGIGAVIASAVGGLVDPSPGQPQVVAVGGGSVTVAPAGAPTAGGVVIGSATIQPGQFGTVNGVQVSVPAVGGAIVVGGSNTVAVAGSGAGSDHQVVTIGGGPAVVNPVTSGGNRAVAIGGQTVQPGQVATINGVVVSVPPSGGSVVLPGGQTVAVNAPGLAATPPTLTFGGSVITADSFGAFVVAPGVTVSPGGPPVTFGSSTISLGPGGSIAILNGVTQTVGPSSPTGSSVVTINGQAVTASVSGSSTAFIIGPGTTLTPGGSIVVSGTTYSLPATGAFVVINGHTSQPAGEILTSAPPITISGQTYSAITSNGRIFYDLGSGTTLTPAGSVVIDGTTISLASDGSNLIFGTSTSKISTVPSSNNATMTTSPSSTSSAKVGDSIAGGVGATRKSSAPPSPIFAFLENVHGLTGALVSLAFVVVAILK